MDSGRREFLKTSSRGMTFERLRDDQVHQRAYVRSLEVIGEAVKNLSDEVKEAHPEIDWRRIAGLRDRLIHHYFGVDWDIVWDTITNKLPDLELELLELLDE